MHAKLYSLALSHPAHAARLMLKTKGIDHEVVNLLPGMHPILLRLRGFRKPTVPALLIDGRRVQGSLKISRELERLRPQPPLFPAAPEERRAVEEAEAWGERDLQELVRVLFRWAAANQPALRRWIAADLARVPAPDLAAAVNAPVARRFARASGASDAAVQAELTRLPAALDRVDRLIEEGTIGGEQPNAADCQIASSIRVLLAFPDLAAAVAERPAGALAQRLFPRYPGPLPVQLPASWLEPLASPAEPGAAAGATP